MAILRNGRIYLECYDASDFEEYASEIIKASQLINYPCLNILDSSNFDLSNKDVELYDLYLNANKGDGAGGKIF